MFQQQKSPTIAITGHTFEGPHPSADFIRHAAGIYVITDARSDGKVYLLDVGESGDVRDRIDNHDRRPCWSRNRQGSLGVAVLYTPGWSDLQRRLLEARIRDQYQPPCGER